MHFRCPARLNMTVALVIATVVLVSAAGIVHCDDTPAGSDLSSVLTPAQWQQVDRSVDRALAWLATQQQTDGSFPTFDTGQPGVTSLCLLALLSRGHLPGEGPYGQLLDKGIDFVLSCKKADGLLSYRPPESLNGPYAPSSTAMYNHALTGLLLCEAYGTTDDRRAARMRPIIQQAIAFTRQRQLASKHDRRDRGGWRYMHPHRDRRDSDLSVTVWHLMFLRSAKNAGFEVPGQWIDEAVDYVQRCFNPKLGVTGYLAGPCTQTRAMAGAGALSLSLAGRHDTHLARATGQWILNHPFDQYNRQMNEQDHYHYGAYYCAQAMFQLGGDSWRQFWPPLVSVLLANQLRDGSWPPESKAETFGRTYSTSLVVLTLSTPNQILPIFQR